MIQGNNEWLLEDLFFAVNDQSNLVIDGILWKLFKFDWSNRKGARHPPPPGTENRALHAEVLEVSGIWRVGEREERKEWVRNVARNPENRDLTSNMNERTVTLRLIGEI